ncbi:MAG: hypothetical protein ACT4OK_00900 [Gemmobacter sp.]
MLRFFLILVSGLTSGLAIEAEACTVLQRGYYDTEVAVPAYGPSCSVELQARNRLYVFSVPRVVANDVVALDFHTNHACTRLKGAFYLDCTTGRSVAVFDGESVHSNPPGMPLVADVLAGVEQDVGSFDQIVDRAEKLRLPDHSSISHEQRLKLLASPVRFMDVTDGPAFLAAQDILPEHLRAPCGCQMLFPASQLAAEFGSMGPPPVVATPNFIKEPPSKKSEGAKTRLRTLFGVGSF